MCYPIKNLYFLIKNLYFPIKNHLKIKNCLILVTFSQKIFILLFKGSAKEKRFKLSPLVITIIGISFIFLMTTLGSAVVFLFKNKVSEKINSLFLGFASGIMIAASVWSLLLPSIEQSSDFGKLNFLPASVGIIVGCLFLVIMDKLVPHILSDKSKFKAQNTQNKKGRLSKSGKIFLVVTLHNIPEGLAVGLAFGNAFVLGQTSAFMSALWLAIGLGLQNLPEGTAVSLPMKEQLGSKKKAFVFGMMSGVVEPIMAVIGIWLSTSLSHLMPWFLSFSAGAMLFVVAEELLPEAKNSHPSSIGSWGFIIGFVLMMILDVALG